MNVKIRAINQKTGESSDIATDTIAKEEIEALIAARFVRQHKLSGKNIIYRAEIQDNE